MNELHSDTLWKTVKRLARKSAVKRAAVAYVSSDAAYRSPFARAYRVREELPYREKQLRSALRERGIGRLTIKKRGVDVVPEELRRRLALSGDDEATLVMTRVAGAGTALLVDPL